MTRVTNTGTEHIVSGMEVVQDPEHAIALVEPVQGDKGPC